MRSDEDVAEIEIWFLVDTIAAAKTLLSFTTDGRSS